MSEQEKELLQGVLENAFVELNRALQEISHLNHQLETVQEKSNKNQ